MNAGREIINTSLLPTQVEDADLRTVHCVSIVPTSFLHVISNSLGHTTVEAGFGIWLVLAVAVTSCWATCHLVELAKVTFGGGESGKLELRFEVEVSIF